MYVAGAGTAMLESPYVGSLAGPFPPEVQQFLEEVRKAPDKHPRLLMAVSNQLNQVPVETLGAILKRDRPLVFKAIKDAPDSAELLKDVRLELAGIRIGHSSKDQKFAQQFDALVDLSNRVDTAFTCVVTWRRLRRHFPSAGKLPIEGSMDSFIKSGQRFLEDPLFQQSFPKLSREIRASIFPRIIYLNVGFTLAQWAALNKQNHENFKKVAAEDCRKRREAEKAASAINGLGWIDTGIDVPVRHIECGGAGLDKIIQEIGPFASREEVIDRLKMDIGHAAFVAHNAVNALTAREEKTMTAFKETFAVDPFRTDLPPGKWTGGQIVKARFAGAFKLLNSGAILYSCWGLPKKAGGPEANPNYTIKVKPNNYWMALGRKYWEESDNDVRTGMCLSAALRIAYGEWVKTGVFSRQANQVTCYIKFAFKLLDADLPAFVANTCPVST